MATEKHYFIVKNKQSGEIAYIDYNQLAGFSFTPKNNIKYNGVVVNKLVVMKPSFVEKVLRKKTKKRLEMFLQFIISLLDDNETGSDPSMVRAALNELTRYKQLVQNKYRLYLEERYTNLLVKKIEILEQELKTKLIRLEWKQESIEKERTGKSR